MTENFLRYSDILTDLHPHLKKKSQILEFLPKISSNFGISDLDIWPKIWPIGQKYSSALYSNQRIFEFNTIIAKVSNVKKPYPPLATRFEGGGGSVLLVTYPSNHLTCSCSSCFFLYINFIVHFVQH